MTCPIYFYQKRRAFVIKHENFAFFKTVLKKDNICNIMEINP